MQSTDVGVSHESVTNVNEPQEWIGQKISMKKAIMNMI